MYLRILMEKNEKKCPSFFAVAVAQTGSNSPIHRLNMELDLPSLIELHVHSCAHWLRPRKPPAHAFRLIYEGAIG